jgi:hypothetical protein
MSHMGSSRGTPARSVAPVNAKKPGASGDRYGGHTRQSGSLVTCKKSRSFPSPAHAEFGPCCFLMVTSSIFAPPDNPASGGSLFSWLAPSFRPPLSCGTTPTLFLCDTNQVRRVQAFARYCKRKRPRCVNLFLLCEAVRRCEYHVVSHAYEKEPEGNHIGLPLLLTRPQFYPPNAPDLIPATRRDEV